MGYSFRLAARVLLHAPSNRQDSTYHTFVIPGMEWECYHTMVLSKEHSWVCWHCINMVKNHTYNEKGNLLLPFHGKLFPIRMQGIIYCTIKWTYHSLCNTSCGALFGTRQCLMGHPWGIDPMTHCTVSYFHHNNNKLRNVCSVWTNAT